MIPVLILTHNNLELTKRAVESVYKQRVSAAPCVFDNGSIDGTREWISDMGICLGSVPFNAGVSFGWNKGLNMLFWEKNFDKALVIGSDTVLPEWFLGSLFSYDVPFVTGVAVDKMPVEYPARMPLSENPDFSAFLIERTLWEDVGPFNERLVNYCGDCDMHVRAHQMGIPLWQANVPFYHERSSTMNKAPEQERAVLHAQAEADRGTFKAIYGCIPGDAKYAELFK